jgi:hypothetical protein
MIVTASGARMTGIGDRVAMIVTSSSLVRALSALVSGLEAWACAKSVGQVIAHATAAK